MKTLLIILGLGIAQFSLAGGGHFHPKKVAKCSKTCSEDEIKKAVPEAIPHLSKWGKIDKAWEKATIESIKQKEFKKGPEWMVTLKNKENKVYYVYFTLDGYVTGANSTGL